MASGAFAEMLAARASVDPEVRRKATVRSVASVLVVLLHVLFVAVLLIVERLPATLFRHRTAAEIQLILAPSQIPAAMPKVIEADKNKRLFQEVIPKPITILPPLVDVPRSPADIMREIGAELDCGASHYEYLNEVERKICHRAPWTMPNANVLVLAKKPPPAPGHMTGAEAAARTRETAPQCLPNNNGLPCIDEVIYGKGPH
jgi:hypothetical protein